MNYEVCYVMKRYLTPYIEGYTVGSKNMINVAQKRGIKSTVFSIEPWNSKIKDTTAHVIRSLYTDKLFITELLSGPHLSLLPNLHDTDIVHFLPNLAGDIYASFIPPKIRDRNKIIAHFSHPYYPYINSPFSNLRLTYLFRKVIDYVFCINNFLMKYFHENTGIGYEKIFNVPFPINTDKYRPFDQKDKLREKYNLSSEYIIAFAGQIEPVRGVYVLLEAFHQVQKSLDNVQLIFSSPGLDFENPHKIALIKMIHQLQLENKVILLPAQENIEEFYNLADLMVFPYIEPYHYMDPPLTMLEAMSSGSLVISTAVGAVNDLLYNNVNGLLVKPKNIEALTESIISTIKNLDDHHHLSIKARESIIEKYSMNRVGNLLEKIYDQIIE